MVGPAGLSAFYRAVIGVDPRVAPVASGASGWIFGLRGDVDALTRMATEAGGTRKGPGELLSPAGTGLHLFGPGHPSALPPEGAGSIGWTELASPDEAVDLAWLAALGVEHEALPVAGEPYHLLRAGGTVIGGCTAARGTIGWMCWVEVVDAEAAAAAVNEHGGTRSGPLRSLDGVGRMQLARDPAGELFGILQPAEGP